MGLLPLFPLQVVLFPSTTLPLHIFEPRYKEMIGECLAQKQPFGVLLARENSWAETGCTAEISKVIKHYDDGCMDILTEGRRRFELLTLDREHAFLRGEVLYFDDDGAEAPGQQRLQAIVLQRELLSLAGEGTEVAATDHAQLSFQLAAQLPLDLEFKQTLLAMRSEQERLQTLIGYYGQLLPKLQRTLQARNCAQGNGHAQ